MKKKQFGIGVTMAIGVGISVAAMLAGIAISAGLIISDRMPVSAQGYCVMVIAVVSSFLGAVAVLRKAEGKKLIISTLFAAVYVLVLLGISALLFEGQYQGIGVTALLILCGATVGAFLGTKDKKRGISRKSKMKHRQFVQNI